MASTYGAWTAPISTRTFPDWRTASKRSEARKPRRTASGARSSPIGLSLEGLSFLDRLDEPVERRIAEEHGKGYDHRVGGHTPRGRLEPAINDDHVGVGRYPPDRRMIHL